MMFFSNVNENKREFLRLVYRSGFIRFFIGVLFVPLTAFTEILLFSCIVLMIALLGKQEPVVNLNDWIEELSRGYFSWHCMIDVKDFLLYIPIFVLFLGFLWSFSRFCSMYLIEVSGHKIARNIRNEILKKYLNSDGIVLESLSGNEYASKVINDINLFQGSIGKNLIIFVREPIILILSLVSILVIAFEFVLPLLFFFLVIFMIMKSFLKYFHYYGTVFSKKQVEFTQNALELSKGFLNVLALRTQSVEEKRLFKSYQDYYITMKRSILLRVGFQPGSEYFVEVILAILLWIHFLGNANFSIKIILLAPFLQPIFRSIKELSACVSQWNEIQISWSRMLNLWEVLSLHKKNIKNIYKESNNSMALELKNINYRSFDKCDILKNITFKLPKGKILMICGESGSGKSTLLKLCAGLLLPHKGELFLEGKPLLATQNSYLFSDTVFANIVYNTSYGENKEVQEGKIKQYLLDLKLAVSQSGCQIFLEKEAGIMGQCLSGGEKARVALARILYADCDILFLDEPTAQMDALSTEAFWNKVKEWKKERDSRTVVVVSHTKEGFLKYDILCVMEYGSIKEWLVL